jgi:hypothetical protein
LIAKLEDWNTGEFICWFLIRKGEYAGTFVPPGTYRLKLACGERWFGEADLFGPDAAYSAISTPLTIEPRMHLTVGLAGSPSGTLREQKLRAENF